MGIIEKYYQNETIERKKSKKYQIWLNTRKSIIHVIILPKKLKFLNNYKISGIKKCINLNQLKISKFIHSYIIR